MKKCRQFEHVIAQAVRSFLSVNWSTFGQTYFMYQRALVPKGGLWWYENQEASVVVVGHEGEIDVRRSIANIGRDIVLLRQNKEYVSSLDLAAHPSGYLAGGPQTVAILYDDGYLGLSGVPALAGYMILKTALYCLGDLRKVEWKHAIEMHNRSIIMHMRLAGMDSGQYELLNYQVTQLVDYAFERVKALGLAD